jgi:peptidyl-tRNA hydrolase, PTH1 family
VAGLGNPGPGYAANRHNVGFLVVDELARRMGANFKRHKSNAFVAEARLAPGAPKLILAKPNSFMNRSGGPVASLLKYFSVAASNLIVIHDEIDIPFDTIRLKASGGHGGHNGIRDIVAALGSGEFIRVRVGVGRPPGRAPAADHVLRDFSTAERTVLAVLVGDAADAVELVVTDGLVAAQQRYHSAR